MERDAWVKEYKRLLTAYNKASNSEQAGVYFDALAGYDAEAVVKAVSAAIMHCKFFPTVADLVARCGVSSADESDPLYPQFAHWQRVNAGDPGMPAITFAMFRHYVEGQR